MQPIAREVGSADARPSCCNGRGSSEPRLEPLYFDQRNAEWAITAVDDTGAEIDISCSFTLSGALELLSTVVDDLALHEVRIDLSRRRIRFCRRVATLDFHTVIGEIDFDIFKVRKLFDRMSLDVAAGRRDVPHRRRVGSA